MGHGTRQCIICGTDISDRHGGAIRCRPCWRKPVQTLGQQTATCVQCGAFFGDKIGRIAANRRYCGPACRDNARAARRGVCRFDPCEKLSRNAGLCSGHAEQSRRGKELAPLRPRLVAGVGRECTFDGCNNAAKARGLCWGHRGQERQGYPLAPLRRRRPTSTHAARDEHGRKRCYACETWKPTTEFSVLRGMADGLYIECRDCAKHSGRLRRFNVTPEQHAAMLRSQGGRCAICRMLPDGGRELAVDHDHNCCPDSARSCGKCVRGLLCQRCNTGIGSLRDDPDLLTAAAEYVRGARIHDRSVVGVAAPPVLAA